MPDDLENPIIPGDKAMPPPEMAAPPPTAGDPALLTGAVPAPPPTTGDPNIVPASTPSLAAELDLSTLRVLRSELQDLQQLIDRVEKGETSLENNANFVLKSMEDIGALITTITSNKYPRYEDHIRHFCNLWEQMQTCSILKDPAKKISPLEQTGQIKTLKEIFNDYIYKIGYLTIPNRINSWLKNCRPGFYVPFHEVFDDEMPDAADRTKLLNVLYYQPEIIKGGLVEPDTGLIYQYSLETKTRVAHFMCLVAAVIVAAGVIIGSAYIPTKEWPLSSANLTTLIIGWLAVVIGVIVHVAVGIGKRMQTEKNRPPIMALSQIPLLLDAKIGQFLFKLLLTVVGFLGLVFAAGISYANPLNAFLVGYSLDSVIELFSVSLDQKSSNQVSALKQKLGV